MQSKALNSATGATYDHASSFALGLIWDSTCAGGNSPPRAGVAFQGGEKEDMGLRVERIKSIVSVHCSTLTDA